MCREHNWRRKEHNNCRRNEKRDENLFILYLEIGLSLKKNQMLFLLLNTEIRTCMHRHLIGI